MMDPRLLTNRKNLLYNLLEQLKEIKDVKAKEVLNAEIFFY
ncbi:hypothetical protein LCGC14_1815710 [marine sediment metagenome]|uniref:Uncharacterized protein n=1 Tax=marine sediment metagenome TaxID=412755 RepID=A0A0F9JK38_9ZZZZ